ncbi:uncharacterized protein DS421_3g65540 [Arachis hypogaea]|nr:uncharacterized protein DS421_3g65540 [Arachis hypogaea]
MSYENPNIVLSLLAFHPFNRGMKLPRFETCFSTLFDFFSKIKCSSGVYRGEKRFHVVRCERKKERRESLVRRVRYGVFQMKLNYLVSN